MSFYEPIKVEEGYDFYICCPTDLSDLDDIEIVEIPKSCLNPCTVVYDELGVINCKEDYFQEYVLDQGVNSSINELFYQIDGKYAFSLKLDQNEELIPADHILHKFKGDKQSAFEYINEKYLENVDEFFKLAPPDYAEWFKEHQLILSEFDESPLEGNLPFFHYVCTRLIRMGEWVDYKIYKITNEGEEE